MRKTAVKNLSMGPRLRSLAFMATKESGSRKSDRPPAVASSFDAVKYDSSKHPGGAQFGFTDGSVRFLQETIADSTFADLCNRFDGDVVSNY